MYWIYCLLVNDRSIPPKMLDHCHQIISTSNKNNMLVMLPRFHGFAKVRVSSIKFNQVQSCTRACPVTGAIASVQFTALICTGAHCAVSLTNVNWAVVPQEETVQGRWKM